MNAVGQIQKHKTDLLSSASLPTICFPLQKLLLKSVAPCCQSPATKISGLFLFLPFYPHTSYQSSSPRFSCNNFTRFYLSDCTTLHIFLPVTGAQLSWKMTFNSALLSPSLCSKLTAVVWYPSRGLVLEFWLFNYLSLDGALIRLAAWSTNVVSSTEKESV